MLMRYETNQKGQGAWARRSWRRGDKQTDLIKIYERIRKEKDFQSFKMVINQSRSRGTCQNIKTNIKICSCLCFFYICCFILVTMDLELIPGMLGMRWEDTLEGMPIHDHTFTLRGKSETPVHVQVTIQEIFVYNTTKCSGPSL